MSAAGGAETKSKVLLVDDDASVLQALDWWSRILPDVKAFTWFAGLTPRSCRKPRNGTSVRWGLRGIPAASEDVGEGVDGEGPVAESNGMSDTYISAQRYVQMQYMYLVY